MADEFRIRVKFTGICVFVQHQGFVTVVIPNANTIRGVTHEGKHGHVPPHIAFAEYDTAQGGINPGRESQVLFSYFNADVKKINVLNLDTNMNGRQLQFAPGGSGEFDTTMSVSWTDVVAMERVVGAGNPIDSTLVSGFDPRSDRVSARMNLKFGSIGPNKDEAVVASFLPASERSYSGAFVQEVLWEITYKGGLSCKLQARPFGQQGDGDDLLTFTAQNGDTFEITIGNAPFEDIIRRGTGAAEIVDHHFAIYYDLLTRTVPVMRLPHRMSEQDFRTRSGAANCPPLLMPLE